MSKVIVSLLVRRNILFGFVQGTGFVAIGIGDTKLGKNGDLRRLHVVGLGVDHVIEAHQMQEAVHEKMAEMVRKGLGLLIRLARDRFEGDQEIA